MSVQKHLAVLAVSVFIWGDATTASASIISGTGSEKVTKGATAVEVRSGYEIDNGRASQDGTLRTRAHLDYGVTDNYALRIIASQTKLEGDSFDHDAVTIENRFELTDYFNTPFGFGARLSYGIRDEGRADRLGFRLIEVVPMEDWELRFNQIFQRDVGAARSNDLTFESRAMVSKQLNPNLKLGLESHNSFGDITDMPDYSEQDHTIGPALIGKNTFLGQDFKYEVGYRAGISRGAPDHAFKLFLNKSF
ncbi:MAG: hypothetical protein CMH25_05755 [Micavibrio sp.]|nr:hypothetical protein [Micavibrio sp.]|tara:strand:+ start:158685 stop:159434 length:750 start_codon:yes stop_codon:yes gene_type:complete